MKGSSVTDSLHENFEMQHEMFDKTFMDLVDKRFEIIDKTFMKIVYKRFDILEKNLKD